MDTAAALHFLVAEAEPVQRRALIEALGNARRHPRHRRAGRLDGAAHAAGRVHAQVDVAIIDLALGGMDGLELLRAIGALKSPVRLIVTGAQPAGVLFSVETLAQAYGLDLLGTIAKPVTSAKLKALLDNYQPAGRAARARGRAELRLRGSRPGPAEAPVRTLLPAQDRAGHRPGEGPGTFARWRHPEHGVLGPGAFIDALEQNNRVDFLDWTMIETVGRALPPLPRPGPADLDLAEPGARTLAHPNFLRQVTSCMGRHGVLPEYLTFEMTESSILNFDADFIERLVRLRMMGFGLAIDDYGTGRSNLQLLARIPFSELKIDRSFVDGASKKRPLGTVLKSCLGLAHSLDRMSVAVGVETRQDWDFLQALGCTYAQGYHIANPMEGDAFPGWLEDWRQFF
jgi:EAL domain-containing protein (putative c-di-GMP-specific phosphodiesterase class I)/DNA-binding NarL/FixJ family response regulator